jgi:hypothetical protein
VQLPDHARIQLVGAGRNPSPVISGIQLYELPESSRRWTMDPYSLLTAHSAVFPRAEPINNDGYRRYGRSRAPRIVSFMCFSGHSTKIFDPAASTASSRSKWGHSPPGYRRAWRRPHRPSPRSYLRCRPASRINPMQEQKHQHVQYWCDQQLPQARAYALWEVKGYFQILCTKFLKKKRIKNP